MKAVAYDRCLPITDPESLVDLELPEPQPGERDLLVRVHAVSVNPVDTKVRAGVAPTEGEHRVLGYDAAGVVQAVGAKVSRFKPGDEVYYAGSRIRPGTNAELHCVDERIVGKKPRSLDFAQAAALPLTTITAWEALFDRLQLPRKVDQDAGTLLVTAGAGGVGSMAVQLARRLTGARVIATASRPESRAQALRLGAHAVIDHSQGLAPQLAEMKLRWVERIFSVSHTHLHYPELVKVIAPQGRICVIDDPPQPLDARPLKARCASLHWEAMFTRSTFETADMIEQGRLLDQVADLIDQGVIVSTHTVTLGPINAANLRQAHSMVESSTTIGKVVLEGF